MNGILLVDKEQNWTSNDAVVKLKGILRQRRVGHAGTLDPMATGLLVVFAGRATRAVSFAEAAEKRYRAALRLGTVPSVILMIGVNGVGKTTTIGKLAARFTAQGKKVLLCAGDTFRAAAAE